MINEVYLTFLGFADFPEADRATVTSPMERLLLVWQLKGIPSSRSLSVSFFFVRICEYVA